MNRKPLLKLLVAYGQYTFIFILIICLTRMLLWAFNPGLFPPAGLPVFFRVLGGGLIFDFSTFCLLHLVFIPFLFIPYQIIQKKGFRIALSVMLGVVGFLALAPNLIDIIYFRFTLRRTTFDVFHFMGTMENEMGGLSVRFLIDFWYMFLLFLVLFAGFFFLMRKTILGKQHKDIRLKYLHQLPSAVLISALLIVGGRGSLNIRPLSILHATKVAGPDFAPLVVNSAFTLIKTYGKQDVAVKNWFDDATVERIFSPRHYYYNPKEPVRRYNVVIIISESLSAEHMGALNNGLTSYTPFLDSLCKNSLVFTNMYANAKRSIEGIPAILSSIPPIMPVPLLTSMYSGNVIPGIGKMLQKSGYETSFFHGGYNGTMNFDGYAAAAGYVHYYGKSEYNGPESDFDGQWGIFDEPFLQFVSSVNSTTRQPFTCSVFTLSAHHPYTVPAQYNGRFPEGPKPILQTIAYADYALKRFFDAASKTSWYNNTLFVITADHASEMYSDCFLSNPANHAIPMIWFHPGDSTLRGRSDVLCQQTDILPSIADYLNLDEVVFAFGNSVFDSTARRFVVMQNDVIYQMLTDGFQMMDFDGDKDSHVTTYRDCRLKTAQASPLFSPEQNLEFLKAIIQQHNNRLVQNRLNKP